jgi:hypothetical protein
MITNKIKHPMNTNRTQQGGMDEHQQNTTKGQRAPTMQSLLWTPKKTLT